MVENNEKHSKIIKKLTFSSWACEAHIEKQRKKFVGQQLGVTPKSCWKSVVFISSRSCRKAHVRSKMKKVVCDF